MKLKRKKALRQILENAEEYMDGVKKCDEILRALPPMPIRKAYVEKWLNDSSSDFTATSDHPLYSDHCSKDGGLPGSDKKSSTQLSSTSNATTMSSHSETMNIPRNTVSTLSSLQKSQKSTKTRRRNNRATVKEAKEQYPLVMGVICPVHSCTCTLSSNQLNNGHGPACPSNPVKADVILEEHPENVISPSSLAVIPEVIASDKDKVVKFNEESPKVTALDQPGALDFFDPLPRLSSTTVGENHEIQNVYEKLAEDFTFPLEIEVNNQEKMELLCEETISGEVKVANDVLTVDGRVSEEIRARGTSRALI